MTGIVAERKGDLYFKLSQRLAKYLVELLTQKPIGQAPLCKSGKGWVQLPPGSPKFIRVYRSCLLSR